VKLHVVVVVDLVALCENVSTEEEVARAKKVPRGSTRVNFSSLIF
jgi:hypothetical protein